jgi:hypothetical protein
MVSFGNTSPGGDCPDLVDLDAEGSRVLVRDMKNPGEKIGNDVWCGSLVENDVTSRRRIPYSKHLRHPHQIRNPVSKIRQLATSGSLLCRNSKAEFPPCQ